MRYAVAVDPEVLRQINEYDPPRAVRDGIADALDGLAVNPYADLFENAVTGPRKMVEVWCDGHLHRFAFGVEIHDDAGAVWVTAVAINPP